MRPSKRTAIVEAVQRVIARDGVAGVTYETVAEESGLTKAGLVYHFATREDLLRGVQEHVAAIWEETMTALAGAPADQLTPQERLAAYVRTTPQSATRGDVLLLLETIGDPVTGAPISGVMNRWVPPIPGSPPLTDQQLRMVLAQLAADGLWLHEALIGTTVPADMRQYLTEQIAALIAQDR
ncbi:TetR/AcrR family transcriptional regulator [Actinoplanes couchii]|uniref:Transcriptional regulator n=1 Tax=Actinoplanes couchii TaxID=403638 RepID=A0ABQ3XL46_9ACTN|nr:TetR/AcrR family transcriptional regulator [Actinoplanes couchii]MDR6318406.1 AcrR family transcriptional regulator [Actinoplanes couchii]GID59228.1 transcriptional regulator [Actinoplanes couchii]